MPSSKYPSVSGALHGVALFGIALLATFGGLTCTALAGDLLRGGYSTSQGGATAPGTFTPPSVIKARQNAKDLLARTTQAIDSVNAMQSAARKLAASAADNLGANPNNPSTTLPNVTNGLTAGGLNPVGGATPLTSGAGYVVPASWSGVGALDQTQSSGQTTVTVVQDAADAILYWTSFNIGRQTTLDFDQNKTGASADTSIAFNIIEDPSGVPSQILGSIEAPGQVYVINQNGIIFGGGSQVNVHTLVASSLPIDTYLIGHGLLNNPDDQFLFSALSQPSGPNGSPAFTPPATDTPDGAEGDVIVQPGAQLYSPANAASVGGRIALIGPNVDNEGSIITPDGQTILAAGLQVGFEASSDPTLRGLDVYIGAVSGGSFPSTSTAGVATNNGLIYVPGGDIYMTGETVDQLGIAASITSVSLNGRIDLLADYDALSSNGITGGTGPFLAQSTGTVLLGNGSVTQILPDWTSSDTVASGQFTLDSKVNIQGLAIHLAGDASLFAPSGAVNINAGTWSYFLEGAIPTDTFANSAGQIYLDSGATIDVQGSWDVSAPVSQNIIPVQLLGPELADSPLQRNGPFAGQTIYVDIRDSGTYDGEQWIGTPLVDDVSSFVALIPYTVGELTTNGGAVNLDAGGSIVLQKGSQVNVSGGWIDYQGGVVTTSEVISGGNIYPINEADPDLVYQGFNLGTFTIVHPTYGISNTYTDPILDLSHYEESYVEGNAGGTLTITAPATALDGQLIGLTADGPRQLDQSQSSQSLVPTPSQLNITYESQTASEGSAGAIAPATSPNIIFSAVNDLPAAAPFSLNSSGDPADLGTVRQQTVILSPDLFTSDGFGGLNIYDVDGNITVPGGVALKPGVDGSVTLAGANVDIQGSITAPGGALSFTTYDFDPFTGLNGLAATPPYNPGRGAFTLGSSAELNTAGLTVDDRPFVPGADTQPLVQTGGSITVTGLVEDLDPGSVIDVSGGVEMPTSGVPVYGNAGSISLKAGEDPYIASIAGGRLDLGATLLGYSGATGGSLTLEDRVIQVGGATGDPAVLLLSPAFFSQGGFASFKLEGAGASFDGKVLPGVEIAPGTQIDPVVTSSIVIPDTDGPGLTTQLMVLPVGERPPVDITLEGLNLNDPFLGTLFVGTVDTGAGSVISTDPLGKVSFVASNLDILGSVFAPGGDITITGALNSAGISSGAYASTVLIGPQSVLSTAGATVYTPNDQGYTTGNVLPGGNISITGNIVAEPGSILNVSGATNTLDVSPLSLNEQPDGYSASNSPLLVAQNGSFAGNLLVPARVDSNGGSIVFSGGDLLFTDATLLGAAGGPSAYGGSVTVSAALADVQDLAPTTPNLTITQSAIPFHTSGLGQPILDSKGNPIAVPGGYFGADSFMSGGFSSLTLVGSVLFQGNVDIQAPGSLTIATGGVIISEGKVTLDAPYVALGQPFLTPVAPSQVQAPFDSGGELTHFAPTYGTGDLTVIADLIDIGNLSLQGIGKANFIADGGDIQGDGTLDIAGAIYMRAAQVYPPTEVTFSIDAYDYTVNGQTEPGTVTFASSGIQETPLSAGGVLNVYASVINQGGVLRAPGGVINLGWDGAGAAPVDLITGGQVDPSQTVTLSAGSITSVSEIDNITGLPLQIPYGIYYDGTDWVDPAGIDITTGGVPAKNINISAANIVDGKGATIDVRGGGDLMAYEFVPGIGGNNDVLGPTNPNGAPSDSFAIIPGYQATYAPYAPFNPDPLTTGAFGGDPGYTSSGFAVGEQVYLDAQGSLAAGVYTLLPARYALLPGAYLVTPNGNSGVVNQTSPDGSYLVSGYQFNSLQSGRAAQPLYTSFDVASSAVVSRRAAYDTVLANTFLGYSAVSNGAVAPSLPTDSGRVEFNATQGLTVQGALLSKSLTGGLGGLVDISSPDSIVIAGPGFTSSAPDTLVLNATELDSFDAASLLIGGSRQVTGDAATVTAETGSITVDNAGDALTGQDIILVSTDAITLDQGADIESTGAASGAENITVAGDGSLLRVSSDPDAVVTRALAAASTPAELTIGSGSTTPVVTLSGGSVILDSSGGTDLDPDAVIESKTVALNSGQISVELTNPGSNAPAPTATSGLILSGNALQTLFATAESISLLSYSSIDFYGAGALGSTNSAGQPLLKDLTLNAGEIRGYNAAGGAVALTAQNILIENAAGASDPGPTQLAPGGALTLNGGAVAFGANTVAVDQFSTVNINASAGMIANASTGSLVAAGDLNLTAPLITGAQGAVYTFSSGGALAVAAPAAASASSVAGGLDANLTFLAPTVTVDSGITAHSGVITLHATTGDLTIGDLASATLDVSGETKTFFDLTEFTNGGQINLISDQGAVDLGSDATVNVAYDSTVVTGGLGGNAGALTISAPEGSATLLGALMGQGGKGAQNGSFSLDAGSIPGATVAGVTYAQGSLDPINAILDAGGFTHSISITDETDPNVTIGSLGAASQPTVIADSYSVSSNNGSITVYGAINASDIASTDPYGNPIAIGGAITLQAQGSVTIAAGAVLNAQGRNFNNAGQGGSIDLEAGSDINGVASTTAFVDIQAGSSILLSVNDATPALGDLSGTLHIRAPQIGAQDDPTGIQVDAIAGAVTGASSITVEGYQIYNTASDNGSIDDQEASVAANGQAFTVNTGSLTQSGNTFTATGLTGGLVGGNTSLETAIAGGATQLVIEPGAEIINTTGNLTLDNSWNLAADRFGPDNVAGDLTLRASGNVVFEFAASLSDGFTGATLSATLLPAGSTSWSYRITSGADFGSANFTAVQSLASLASGQGSVLIGQGALPATIAPDGNAADTPALDFQTIRTGVGDITISAGRDVQLLDTLATIYTAGTQAPALASFNVPKTTYTASQLGPQSGNNVYPTQYSYEGGNIAISAQNDIEDLVIDPNTGQLVPDSTLELPTSWLDRRGYINPITGQFGTQKSGFGIASTSWWVDFSNFFQDVGALGGGNVTLTAGANVSNVDAVIPTDARANETGSVFQEFGGGDLSVTAGNDIDAGIYYVERGNGQLTAGNSIITNYTRTAAVADDNGNAINDPSSWLPTTLFLGAGSFNVTAGGGILLGSVANPFLLPQSLFNSFDNRTFFSTFATTDQVNISSLTGNVTIQGNSAGSVSSLLDWYQDIFLQFQNVNALSATSEPWLVLGETSLATDAALTSLFPATVRVTAFSGSIDIQGDLTLSPAPDGTLELAAAGSINALQPVEALSSGLQIWEEGSIDVSDANPNLIPGVLDPLGQLSPTFVSNTDLLSVDALFNASGSLEGAYAVIQTKEALHADLPEPSDPSVDGPLHADDPNPLRIYAGSGDISGLTLFSPKVSDVIAGQDITDVALYIQNDQAADVSVVSAGRDIIPYDPTSPLVQAADAGDPMSPVSPNAGDIQIAGPGAIEILAGRNFTAGVGANNNDGTAVGITSIGNQANPILPSDGAGIILAAGLGGAAIGLQDSSLDLQNFATTILTSAGASTYLADLAATEDFNVSSYDDYKKLSRDQQAIVALDLFYLVLRDAGRDHNLVGNPGHGNYAAGDAAIQELLGADHASTGDINLTSKELTTETGGDIDILDPAGQLTVGVNLSGAQPVAQGIFTDDGGNVSIYTQGSVNLGTSRIFTLQGGNIIIWSNQGNIDAGNSSKTVQSAPPTRVVVDPQSGNVETDLAGLATGGGIGVLATVVGVPPGNVDLIAPTGVIDAGNAGIRATGNLNLAAVQILNASNIQAGGSTTGAPTVTVAAPNLGGLAAASSAAGANAAAANDQANSQNQDQSGQNTLDSVISVSVIGYGGGDDSGG